MWDYRRIIEFNPSSYMKFEYRIEKWDPSQDLFINWLNYFGMNGWELVSCEPLVKEIGCLCIIKRVIK